jgi:hypothetical protein
VQDERIIVWRSVGLPNDYGTDSNFDCISLNHYAYRIRERLKIVIFPKEGIYVFGLILTVNSSCFRIKVNYMTQTSIDEMCLLRCRYRILVQVVLK